LSRELDNYLKVEELKPEGALLRSYSDKPVIGAIISVGLGAALFLMPYLIVRILGVLLALGGLYVLLIYRSQKVLSLYEKGAMVHKELDESQAIYLPYRQISGWSHRRTNLAVQNVIFMLRNGDYLYVETPDLKPMKKLLRERMPDKEFSDKGGKKK